MERARHLLDMIDDAARVLLKAEAPQASESAEELWEQCLPGYRDCLRRKVKILLDFWFTNINDSH